MDGPLLVALPTDAEPVMAQRKLDLGSPKAKAFSLPLDPPLSSKRRKHEGVDRGAELNRAGFPLALQGRSADQF